MTKHKPFPFLFISLLICFFSINTFAQTQSVELRLKLDKFFSQMQIDSVEMVIEQLEQPGYKAFYQNNILTYQYLATQKKEYARLIRKDWKETLKALSELPDSDTLKLIMLSETQCKKAIIEFLDKNYLTAIRHARLGRSFIKESEKKFPNNLEQNKITGIFNVAFGAVPSKYQWLTQTLGFRGNTLTGIKQLELAAQNSTILKFEALLLVFFAEKNLLNQPQKAIVRLEREKNTRGPAFIMDYFLATGYQGLKQNDKSIPILQNRDVYINQGILFSPYWDYALARAHYYKAENDKAQLYFAQFIENHQGDLYRTDALFRLGMAYTLNDNYQKGREYFQKISQEESSGFDEDEYANFMAKSFIDKKPDQDILELFKARNLFDGGYFRESLKILATLESKLTTLSGEEKTELYYRFGRIYQATNKLKQAKIYYLKSTEQVSGSQKWMQAYSFYYLAEMTRAEADYTTAKLQYKKALTFDDYFYQSGLENRCKIALSEIKKK